MDYYYREKLLSVIIIFSLYFKGFVRKDIV